MSFSPYFVAHFLNTPLLLFFFLSFIRHVQLCFLKSYTSVDLSLSVLKYQKVYLCRYCRSVALVYCWCVWVLSWFLHVIFTASRTKWMDGCGGIIYLSLYIIFQHVLSNTWCLYVVCVCVHLPSSLRGTCACVRDNDVVNECVSPKERVFILNLF